MSEAKNILIKNDLRPTSQRLAIINYILENHKIHITADKLIKHFKDCQNFIVR